MGESTRQNSSSPESKQQSRVIFSPETVEQLLQLGMKAACTGNKDGARALLRALVRKQPGELRAWLWLAGVAETLVEQQHALEQVIQLDPHHQIARQGLERVYNRLTNISTSPPGASPTFASRVPTAEAVTAVSVEQSSTRTLHNDLSTAQPRRMLLWLPILFIGGLSLSFVLLWIVDGGVWSSSTGQRKAQPTPTLLGRSALLSATTLGNASVNATSSVPAPTPPVSVVPDATDVVRLTPSTLLTSTPSSTARVTPTILPLGSIVEHDGWQATLLRPDYALVFEGRVGDKQPHGRYVLALLAVGNTLETSRSIPPDLFMLVDNQGRSYQPDAEASVIYLEVYGRGQRGDRAVTDFIPTGSGLYSMPLLFDVPRDTVGLILTMGTSVKEGWPVLVELRQEASPELAFTPNAGP